ncbi:outer membrane beta-barrel protein [Sulfurimonas sp. MAG313]|nr:outer membrane beta-barrel protein [Sulfurimonas sp. MAG313]MDF1880028.1 outer membrane beta-barrel protein [Sulfurimonas sp. MAG313]
MKIVLLTLLAVSLQAAQLYMQDLTIVDETSLQSPELKEKELSKVVLQESVPGFSQPIIKGLQGDKISIGLDGMTFSNSLFRSGPNQYFSWIPQGFVSRLEVGEYLENGALGGGINMSLGINKTQVVLDKTQNRYTFLGTYAQEDFQGGVSVIEADNVYDTQGEVPHSAYNQKAVMIKKQFGNDEVTLMHSQSDEIDRTDVFAQGKYYVYDLQQYTMAKYDKHFDSALLSLSYQRFIDNVDKKTRYTNTTNNIYGLNLSALYEPTDLDGTFSYGLQNSFEDIKVDKGVQNDYLYALTSAYLKYDTYFNDYELSLYYKHSFMNMSGALDKSMNDFSTGLVLSNSGYYLSMDKSIKFPTVVNLSEAKGDDVNELSNPDLTSETSFNYTLGYKNKNFEASVYYKDLKDMIIREQTNIISPDGSLFWQYQNANKGKIYGAYLWAQKQYLQNYKTSFSMEYTYGKTEYDYISKLTPFRLELKNTLYKDYYINFKYAPPVSEDKMAKKDTIDIRIDGKNYGYRIVDIGYKTQYQAHTMEVGVTNLLNDQGRIYGSSVDFSRRALRLQYAYVF